MPRLAVLGRPVSHSRSPAMHNAALAELGLSDWSYEAIEVTSENFEDLVRSLPGDGFAGVNVTVPHKAAALAVADEVSREVDEIGAANTLTFAGGTISADNTDAAGLIAALPDSPGGKRALVLGAGGSARAVVWALVHAGGQVAIWNRTPEKAHDLASEFGVTSVTEGDLRMANGEWRIANLDLIVNATTVGMAQASGEQPPRLKGLPLGVDGIQARHLVVDLVYGPVQTPLISAANERGARTVDGLEVLVHQGAASLRLWTGKAPPLETMRQAARGLDAQWQPKNAPDT